MHMYVIYTCVMCVYIYIYIRIYIYMYIHIHTYIHISPPLSSGRSSAEAHGRIASPGRPWHNHYHYHENKINETYY